MNLSSKYSVHMGTFYFAHFFAHTAQKRVAIRLTTAHLPQAQATGRVSLSHEEQTTCRIR
jgi:hypothetical protein